LISTTIISTTLLMAQTPKPRIAVGGIMHESNTFSKVKTDLQDFAGRLITRGDEIFAEFATSAHEVGGYIEGAQKYGLELVPTIVANATPADPVTDRALDTLTGELIDRLKKAQPLDGLLLALHGAMVTESHLGRRRRSAAAAPQGFGRRSAHRCDPRRPCQRSA
jgi:microcystin degradation protein MlrC